jgi:hypothetical protein
LLASASLRTNTANCAGVMRIGSAPSFASFSCTSGDQQAGPRSGAPLD